jgi:dihydrofolate reductase
VEPGRTDAAGLISGALCRTQPQPELDRANRAMLVPSRRRPADRRIGVWRWLLDIDPSAGLKQPDWPYQVWEDAPNGGIPKVFNAIKKYVVSRSGGVDTSWQGGVLLCDIADVKRPRDEDGPNLLTQGSTELVHELLANDLVDAMSIFSFPVVLGGGKTLFADGSAPRAYKLTRSRVTNSGVMIGHYERDGEIKVGDTALN